MLLKAAILSASLLVLSTQHASAQESSQTLKGQLDAKSAEFQKAAPDAAKSSEEGIKEVAATGIVEKAPKVGEKAGLFKLSDANGKVVKLADLLKKGPVVLTWYRGGWCPYCNLSLRSLVKAEPSIRALGATLVAITPETPDNSAETALTDAITFQVLSDPGNKVAHLYRISYKLPAKTSAAMKAHKIDLAKRNGDASDELPLPATFVVDTDQTIRWAFVDADYRKRAEPGDILAALKKLKK